MSCGGHDIEWLPPDDAEPAVPVSALDAGGGALALSRRWLHRRWVLLRRPLCALVLLGVLVVASVVLVRERPAHRLTPTAAPAWLVNAPSRAFLSPYMAAECFHHHCVSSFASPRDLLIMRRLLGTGMAVSGMRIVDAHGQLRGVSVSASDAEGDLLSINAVRVSRPPAHWEGGTAGAVDDGTQLSRWVLHAKSGIWLAEADASGSCPPNPPDSLTLYEIVLNRIQPGQLHV